MEGYGTATVQLAKLHGDITATRQTPGIDWLDTYTEHTEYGVPRAVLADQPWYGCKLRRSGSRVRCNAWCR